MLFDAHTRAFAALEGIPRRGIYDNMKTAVDRIKKGKGLVVNARFATLRAHHTRRRRHACTAARAGPNRLRLAALHSLGGGGTGGCIRSPERRTRRECADTPERCAGASLHRNDAGNYRCRR